MKTVINKKPIYWGIFFVIMCSCTGWGYYYYNSPENVAKRYQRITDEYMSQFTSATLLHTDGATDDNYRYIYADNCIYKFSPKNNIALKYICFSNTITCSNGQTINGSIQNIYFINENMILLQMKDKETFQYIGYRKKDLATKFSIEYITDSSENPNIKGDCIMIYKNGTFKEGGEYRHHIKYYFTSLIVKHEIYDKETNELLGDERYLDYNFRQKEKLRKAEETRQEELRRAEEARQEELRKAEEAKRIEFNNKIANAQPVESVLKEFQSNEPAAREKYCNKKAVYKGIVKRVKNSIDVDKDILSLDFDELLSQAYKLSTTGAYEICLDSPIFDVIHFYSDDKTVLNISAEKQIVFEGRVSSFSNSFGSTLRFSGVTILQYQK